MKTGKIMIFQAAYSSSGLWVAGDCWQLLGIGGHPHWTGHASIARAHHVHTHSYWDNLDTAIHLIFTSLGCMRKLGYLEKTYADMGRMCELHTHNGSPGEYIFFLLSML